MQLLHLHHLADVVRASVQEKLPPRVATARAETAIRAIRAASAVVPKRNLPRELKPQQIRLVKLSPTLNLFRSINCSDKVIVLTKQAVGGITHGLFF